MATKRKTKAEGPATVQQLSAEDAAKVTGDLLPPSIGQLQAAAPEPVAAAAQAEHPGTPADFLRLHFPQFAAKIVEHGPNRADLQLEDSTKTVLVIVKMY